MKSKNALLIGYLLIISAVHAAENRDEEKALAVARYALLNQSGCVVTFYDENNTDLGTFGLKRIMNKRAVLRLAREIRTDIGVDITQLKKQDITLENKLAKCAIL